MSGLGFRPCCPHTSSGCPSSCKILSETWSENAVCLRLSPVRSTPTPEGMPHRGGKVVVRHEIHFKCPQHTTCHFRLKIKSVLPDRLGMPLPAAECRGTPSGGCRSFHSCSILVSACKVTALFPSGHHARMRQTYGWKDNARHADNQTDKLPVF